MLKNKRAVAELERLCSRTKGQWQNWKCNAQEQRGSGRTGNVMLKNKGAVAEPSLFILSNDFLETNTYCDVINM